MFNRDESCRMCNKILKGLPRREFQRPVPYFSFPLLEELVSMVWYFLKKKLAGEIIVRSEDDTWVNSRNT